MDKLDIGISLAKIFEYLNSRLKFYSDNKQNRIFIEGNEPELQEDGDIWFDISNSLYTITIIQPNHATISLKNLSTGVIYTQTCYLKYNSKFTLSIIPELGYSPDNIFTYIDGEKASKGVVNTDLTVTGDSPQRTIYHITIEQVDHQQLRVHHNNNILTGNTTLPYGEIITCEIVPDTGYNPGELFVIGGTKQSTGVYKVTSDMTIRGTGYNGGNMPSRIEYTITIIQSEHQTIVVHNNSLVLPNVSKLPYQSTITVDLQPDTGYNPGELYIQGGTKIDQRTYSVTSDMTISGKGQNGNIVPQLKYFTLSIIQTQYQQITVAANGHTYTSNVSLPYGTNWTAIIKSTDSQYKPGTLNKSSGTITKDDVVQATPAILDIVIITINQIPHSVIKVTEHGTNTIHTSSFRCKVNTVLDIANTKIVWWNPGNLIIDEKNQNTLSLTLTATKNITITAVEATRKTNYTFEVKFAAQWGNDGHYVKEERIGYQSLSYLNNGNSVYNDFGAISPEGIFDCFAIQHISHTLYCTFYGIESVAGLFKYFNCTLITEDGTKYKIFQNIPNSKFSGTGDLTMPGTQELDDLYVSLIGKKVTLEMNYSE